MFRLCFALALSLISLLPLACTESSAPPREVRLAAEAYYKAKRDKIHTTVHEGDKFTETIKEHLDGFPAFVVTDANVESINLIKEGVYAIKTAIKGTSQSRNFSSESNSFVTLRNKKWMVDWPATVGYNETPLKALRATTPEDGAIVRVIADISDYYNFHFSDRKETHWAIKLKDTRGKFIHGYVEKESKLGQEVYKIIKDGKPHKLTLRVQFEKSQGSVSETTKIVSNSWVVD